MAKTEVLYVVSNYGEYVDHIRKTNCGWSFSPLCDSLSKNYSRAYNIMKKVNKAYGFNRCSVEKLKPSDWNGYFWNQLLNNAQ